MRKLIILSIAYLASFVSANMKYGSKEFTTNAQVNNDVDKVNNDVGWGRMKKSHYRSYSKKKYNKSYSSKRWERSHSWKRGHNWKKANSKEFKTNVQVNNDVDKINNHMGNRLLAR